MLIILGQTPFHKLKAALNRREKIIEVVSDAAAAEDVLIDPGLKSVFKTAIDKGCAIL
jgi:hypothetical protein